MPTGPHQDGSDLAYVQYERHLYFSDNRIREKTIVDVRYDHDGKLYLPVNRDIFSDGDYELISFRCFHSRYHVKKILDISRRTAYRVSGLRLRHQVEARLVNADDDDDPDPD